MLLKAAKRGNKFFLISLFEYKQLALANFYEQDDNNPMDGSVINMLEDDNDDGDIASATPAATFARAGARGFATTTKSEKKEKKAPTAKPRIATIHNMSKSSSEDEEEQGQVKMRD